MATECVITAQDEDKEIKKESQEAFQPRIIVDNKTRPFRKRIWELDFLRGVCILLMVIDHIFVDISDMFRYSWLASGKAGAILAVERADNYLYNIVTSSGTPMREPIHIAVLWCFFGLCGISCYFSRNNIKRTVQVSVCAGLITLFTYIFEKVTGMPMTVRYGVLQMLATCIFIYTLIELVCKLLIKDKVSRRIAISLICLAIGIAAVIWNNKLNEAMLESGERLGKNGAAFLHSAFYYNDYSSDYFPLLENLYMVMFGAAVAPLIYPKKKSLLPFLDGKWNKPFCFCGRHTLIIVIVHQLVITGVLVLISCLFITPGSAGI